MITFKQFLTENTNIAKLIAKQIDHETRNVSCSIYKECHEAVTLISRKRDISVKLSSGVDFKFYNELKFVMWRESKWDQFSKTVDNSYKRVGVKHFTELVEDIRDGTINGHSYIKWKGYYIDPHLSSAGVSFENIQKCGRWFDSIYRKIGIL
jgi:hypothetical protein